MGLQKLIRGKTARDGEVSLPAFYAFRAGSWRDYVNLLHPPYTVWHLSYVALGWALAPSTHWDRLGAVTLAFFLAVGISSHSLDELHGRPLKTNIPSPVLAVLAVASLLGALAIGVAGVFTISLWLLPFIVLGTFFALAYNLELARGWFHTGFWFGIAWGAFPVLTGYFANWGGLAPEAFIAAAAAFFFSVAQRALSGPVRSMRRKVLMAQGSLTMKDGTVLPLSKGNLLRAPERALQALSLVMVLLAGALLLGKA